MNRPTITNAIVKQYPPEREHNFRNELYFYRHYPRFCPELLMYDETNRILVIEKCYPIIEVPNSIMYKQPLWDLLELFHKSGANHRDISLVNVVVHNTRGVLLIDFEHATEKIGTKSIDLFGCIEAGVKNEIGDCYGPNGIWWHGTHHDCTPGRFWS